MSIIATITSQEVPPAEIFDSVDGLRSNGHTPILVGRSPGPIRSTDGFRTEKIDVVPESVNIDLFDGMLVPCNASGLDEFIIRFWDTGRPLAAVASGLRSILRTGIARGKTVAPKPQMRLQACAAGASWIDARMIVDGGLITAPDGSEVRRVCQAIESQTSFNPRMRRSSRS